ncbi:cyclic nucleotide-binding domain-containing protein [Ditylenchus destructor]|uniref:Cyclic nucleotide-binding domain-containing protein n=1 Tax=Ditylenchus destructor TaxID=166010 RepID=A0AAD4MRG4_9BILA|nr:cyclic nucleotide-binding domain-containing protein [Ditylenchus destructor]
MINDNVTPKRFIAQSEAGFHSLSDIVSLFWPILRPTSGLPEDIGSHLVLPSLIACGHEHLNLCFGRPFFTPKRPSSTKQSLGHPQFASLSQQEPPFRLRRLQSAPSRRSSMPPPVGEPLRESVIGRRESTPGFILENRPGKSEGTLRPAPITESDEEIPSELSIHKPSVNTEVKNDRSQNFETEKSVNVHAEERIDLENPEKTQLPEISGVLLTENGVLGHSVNLETKDIGSLAGNRNESRVSTMGVMDGNELKVDVKRDSDSPKPGCSQEIVSGKLTENIAEDKPRIMPSSKFKKLAQEEPPSMGGISVTPSIMSAVVNNANLQSSSASNKKKFRTIAKGLLMARVAASDSVALSREQQAFLSKYGMTMAGSASSVDESRPCSLGSGANPNGNFLRKNLWSTRQRIITIVGLRMIANMSAARSVFQTSVDSVKQYMKMRCVGKHLVARVLKWFDYLWANKQTLNDQQVLNVLPTKLQAEIAMHVHFETLRKVRIFQDCEAGLLAELALKLQLQVFRPNDYVCRKGDIGREMYIVKRGRLQVVSDDGKKVFTNLQEGSVFGELSILNIAGSKIGNRRSASIRSVGYTDLFVLNKNDLWEALQEYPGAQKVLMIKAREILRKDNLMENDAPEETKTPEEIALDLRSSLERLQFRFAKLIAEHVNTENKLKNRLQYLEEQCRKYGLDEGFDKDDENNSEAGDNQSFSNSLH